MCGHFSLISLISRIYNNTKKGTFLGAFLGKTEKINS